MAAYCSEQSTILKELKNECPGVARDRAALLYPKLAVSHPDNPQNRAFLEQVVQVAEDLAGKKKEYAFYNACGIAILVGYHARTRAGKYETRLREAARDLHQRKLCRHAALRKATYVLDDIVETLTHATTEELQSGHFVTDWYPGAYGKGTPDLSAFTITLIRDAIDTFEQTSFDDGGVIQYAKRGELPWRLNQARTAAVNNILAEGKKMADTAGPSRLLELFKRAYALAHLDFFSTQQPDLQAKRKATDFFDAYIAPSLSRNNGHNDVQYESPRRNAA